MEAEKSYNDLEGLPVSTLTSVGLEVVIGSKGEEGGRRREAGGETYAEFPARPLFSHIYTLDFNFLRCKI